jgi:hypothetical protein
MARPTNATGTSAGCWLHYVAALRSMHQKTLAIAVSTRAHYNWLSKWAETNGARRWSTVLEHHYTGHLAQQAQWLHMRAGATYVDEDYMGRVKQSTACFTEYGLLNHRTHALLATRNAGGFAQATEEFNIKSHGVGVFRSRSGVGSAGRDGANLGACHGRFMRANPLRIGTEMVGELCFRDACQSTPTRA